MSRAPGNLLLRIACIALAGTIGAMGMLGHRRGGAVELFAAGGHLILSRAAPIVAALIGIAIHGVWMLVWAVLTVAIAQHHGGRRGVIAAIVVSAVALAAALTLPTSLIGPLATLTVGERVLVHVVLMLSLILGMRLAFPGDVRAAQRVRTSEGRWLA